MNASEKFQRLVRLRQEIQGSEAYIGGATGSDRRAEQRHLSQLRREYHALREQAIDSVTTDGEAGVLAGMSAA